MSEHASKDSLEAMKQNDQHNTGHDDAVPGGTHAHSPAAHESGPAAHTKAVGDLRDLEDKEESARQSGLASTSYRGS